MSYDLRLVNSDGTTATLTSPAPRGGTFALGDYREAEFNITYNYWPYLRAVLGPEGIRTLYGMTGAASAVLLTQAILALQDDDEPDYWKATEGNTRRALVACLSMALQCPTAVWQGD